MSYAEYTTVVEGVSKQLEACISAIDQAQNGKQDPPDELDQLTNKLEEARQLCTIVENEAIDEDDEEEDQVEPDGAPLVG